MAAEAEHLVEDLVFGARVADFAFQGCAAGSQGR
jgi:hypothetical protein